MARLGGYLQHQGEGEQQGLHGQEQKFEEVAVVKSDREVEPEVEAGPVTEVCPA